jgi:predicted phosphodiesterase
MKLAIIADAHGNYPALCAVLAEIDRLGCERIISLGDATGYYAQPAECLDALIERDALQLLGNHDNYLVQGSSCERSKTVSELIIHQRKEMQPRHMAALNAMRPSHDEGDMRFVHGSWEDPLDGYLYKVSAAQLPGNQRFYFAGHSHVQHLSHFGEKTFCNPGSVGQPRDGDPRAAFAVLTDDVITLHRVPYKIEETVLAMQRSGYQESRLWEILFIGAQIGGRIDRITSIPSNT